MKLGPRLKWNDLADDYDKVSSGSKARTLPMEQVFDWAEKQTDKYYITEEGYIHKILSI